MNHCNVETYHKLKDTKLKEDKKINQSDIKNLKFDLMFWILIKIYRTVLNLI